MTTMLQAGTLACRRRRRSPPPTRRPPPPDGHAPRRWCARFSHPASSQFRRLTSSSCHLRRWHPARRDDRPLSTGCPSCVVRFARATHAPARYASSAAQPVSLNQSSARRCVAGPLETLAPVSAHSAILIGWRLHWPSPFAGARPRPNCRDERAVELRGRGGAASDGWRVGQPGTPPSQWDRPP